MPDAKDDLWLERPRHLSRHPFCNKLLRNGALGALSPDFSGRARQCPSPGSRKQDAQEECLRFGGPSRPSQQKSIPCLLTLRIFSRNTFATLATLAHSFRTYGYACKVRFHRLFRRTFGAALIYLGRYASMHGPCKLGKALCRLPGTASNLSDGEEQVHHSFPQPGRSGRIFGSVFGTPSISCTC